MDTRFYQSPELDPERIAQEFASILLAQGNQVQHFGSKEHMVVQLRQGSDLEAFIGMQAALTITLQSVPGGMIAVVGQQQWADKAALGAIGVFFFWPLIATAGVGVIRQATLESQVLSTLDGVVLRQKPGTRVGPVPPEMQSQWQQQPPPPFSNAPFGPGQQPQYTPMPGIQCPNCQEINEMGDLYCSHCGKPLAQQKKHCPQCNAENKTNAAFCTQCGASLSQQEPTKQ
ncbi:MAG TPA: zinc ribbon domain-containing protein [Ktedonobacteraceae bacterium]|nr:zinc ribbon domain-containing protein [Ktedonobacteraceae bacterium]